MDIKPWWDAYYKPLYFYCCRVVGQQDVAEDIVEETFIKLYNARHHDNPKAFLYVTCRNACYDHLRSIGIHRRIHEQIPPPDQNEADDYNMMYTEYITELHKRLPQLPLRCREVFEMYLKGFTTRQITNSLKISEQTARNQKTKAIGILQQLLGMKKPAV